MNIACYRMRALLAGGFFEEIRNVPVSTDESDFWFIPCLLHCSRISRSRAVDGLARQRRRLYRDSSGLEICAKIETQQPISPRSSYCWAIYKTLMES
jgi:hypothetical protein